MTAQKNVLLATLLALATAGAWFLLDTRTGQAEEMATVPEGPRIVRSRNNVNSEAEIVLDRAAERSSEGGEVATRVEHPLEVELTLLQRGTFETEGNLLPPGSGANARLTGHILGNGGKGAPGTVTFLAGPNAGRVLRTDSGGNFGASDLYQGLGIVEIETDFGVRSVRQVMLRQLSTAELNVTLGREVSTSVRGLVKNRQGEPIHGAEVQFDGGRAFTDDLGEFFFPRVSPGKVLAVVSKPGFAKYQEIVAIPMSSAISKENIQFILHEGASLELRVEQVVGGRGPSLAYIFPVGGQRVNSTLGQNTFPWHEVNPIEIFPGGTNLIEGLQPGNVILTIFHPGAIASPPFQTKKLQPGRKNVHAFRLRAAPTLRGEVRGPDGKPSAGATVVLEAPDRGNATTKILQKKPTFSLEMVVPILPSGSQTVKTDRSGQFAMTLYEEVAGSFYLTAVDSTGELRANRVVTSSPDQIELELQPVDEDRSSMEIRMGGRFQGLPVRLSVNGTPMDPYVLAPEDKLEIEGLEAGTWRAEVWWHHEQLERGRQVTLKPNGRGEISVVLPRGALEGEPEPTVEGSVR